MYSLVLNKKKIKANDPHVIVGLKKMICMEDSPLGPTFLHDGPHCGPWDPHPVGFVYRTPIAP